MSSDKSHQAMQKIWNQVSIQAPDGQKYMLFKSKKDIEYLYCTGLVDEKTYTLSQWMEAFADSVMPNGMYMVNEIQWMDKTPFRYTGPVGRPFNPMVLRDGEWSEEEMGRLVQEKILPSVYITAEQFEKILSDVRKSPVYRNGHFLITDAVKKDLKSILDDYPSSQRIRELRTEEAQGLISSPGKTTTAFSTNKPASQVAAEKLQQLLSKK